MACLYADKSLTWHGHCSHTPTPEDYLRFLTVLPDLVVGRNPLVPGAMAWSTIKSAEYSISHSLVFHHREWQLTKHDAARMDALMFKNLKDGRVTKEPSFQKQWSSAMLVKQMVHAILRDAIKNGTRSWDVTIHKCLSLVLEAATCSRSGDIRQTQRCKEPVHLRWEHITIKITGTGEHPRMRMPIKLLYTKGHK